LLEEGAIDRDAFAAGVTLRGWCETLFRGLKTQSWDVPIDDGATDLVRPTMSSSPPRAGCRP
jgi:hypothetical protein